MTSGGLLLPASFEVEQGTVRKFPSPAGIDARDLRASNFIRVKDAGSGSDDGIGTSEVSPILPC